MKNEKSKEELKAESEAITMMINMMHEALSDNIPLKILYNFRKIDNFIHSILEDVDSLDKSESLMMLELSNIIEQYYNILSDFSKKYNLGEVK